MRCLLIALLLVSAGCRTTIGPRQVRQLPRPDDPTVSIEEQERRGRARLSIPQDYMNLLPYGGIGAYGSTNPQNR
jgi:hypothetical protein